MSCPTCDHTMNSLGGVFWWCPRCGTVMEHDKVWKPTLVDRCRQFEKFLMTHYPAGFGLAVATRENWKTIGIHEAINTPEKRLP